MVPPLWIAGAKTANFDVKPEVSGMPAKASRSRPKMPATTGCVATEAGPLREVGCLGPALADHRHDRERGQSVGQTVGDEGRTSRLAMPLPSKDSRPTRMKTCVGDRGVGEQPLDIGLGHRQHSADDHRSGRDEDPPDPPVPTQASGPTCRRSAGSRRRQPPFVAATHEAGGSVWSAPW